MVVRRFASANAAFGTQTMTKKIYWGLLLAIALTGGSMLSASLRYPWHTVSEQEIGNLSARLRDKPRDVRFREWYEERAKLVFASHDSSIRLGATASSLAFSRHSWHLRFLLSLDVCSGGHSLRGLASPPSCSSGRAIKSDSMSS